MPVASSIEAVFLYCFAVSPQNKLLGNFFHMYSKSTHHLVEFVADRISSNLIKDLRHKALPSALRRCEGEVCEMATFISYNKGMFLTEVNNIFFICSLRDLKKKDYVFFSYPCLFQQQKSGII